MTEIWEIARIVEEHPDDYEQRWRLAKKLYMAWEYRLALEHLQILKNEWKEKVNIVRYLAATYYRLGRYEESIQELERSVKIWPQEIGLQEQLARVYEVAENKEEAARVWEQIQALDPHHPIAANAVKRLRKNEEASPEEDLHLMDSDSGIDLSPGRVCPSCGAQNSEDFSRCWQCHAPLAAQTPSPGSPVPAPSSKKQLITPESLSLVAGIVVLCLLSLSLYLSLRLLVGSSLRESGSVYLSLGELYTYKMVLTRIVTGILLLVSWPIVLHLLLISIKLFRPAPPALVNLTGLFLASLTYVLTWLPGSAPLYALPISSALSLLLIFFLLQQDWARSLLLCFMQSILMLAISFSSVLGMEILQTGIFLNPIEEIPAIAQYAQSQEGSEHPGAYYFPSEALPFYSAVKWESTGSVWLDRRAAKVEFSVASNHSTGEITFELNQGDTEPRIIETTNEQTWFMPYKVRPNEAYYIHVTGPPETSVRLTIKGLLLPHFETPEQP